jgi:hypothetical protein
MQIAYEAAVGTDLIRVWRHDPVVRLLFLLYAADGERTLLVCETRTAATDPLSGMRFRRYWVLARPGVWLILGRLLAAIRREAEARARRARTVPPPAP